MGQSLLNCPIASPETRVNDCLKLWIEARGNYFLPDRFRLSLNNCIQSLRNVTFVLQKHKYCLPTFDNWYSGWQSIMRRDPLLKWLVRARNVIVKQGELETYSKVRVELVESWFDSPKVEMTVPPFTRTEDLARLIAQRSPKNIALDVGLLRVERRWVESSLPHNEVLEVLAHCFHVLVKVLFDAHKRLMHPDAAQRCAWYKNLLPSGGALPSCMCAQEWDRTVWVDLKDNSVLVPLWHPVAFSSREREEAVNAYQGIRELRNRLAKRVSLKEKAEILFKQAKQILLKDGHHVPIALLGYPDGQQKTMPMLVLDRKDKHLAFRQLAAEVERTLATSVILINEIWISFPSTETQILHAADDPTRREGLHLIAADAEGHEYAYTVLFHKNDRGEVNLEDEVHSEHGQPEHGQLNILAPIREVWKRRKEALEQEDAGDASNRS